MLWAVFRSKPVPRSTRLERVTSFDGQPTAAPTDTMDALSEADLGVVPGGNGSGPGAQIQSMTGNRTLNYR